MDAIHLDSFIYIRYDEDGELNVIVEGSMREGAYALVPIESGAIELEEVDNDGKTEANVSSRGRP